MICSSFSLGVSKFDSRRTCSRMEVSRFCASSKITTLLRPARRCSIRKALRATSRWTRVLASAFTPKSFSMYSRISSKVSVEL